MEHFAGLDVSVKDTSVCIVDDTGKIVREVKVASEPEALLAVLKNPGHQAVRPRCPLSAKTCREQVQQTAALFDHLVGDGEHSWRNCNSERLGRFDIQNQFKAR